MGRRRIINLTLFFLLISVFLLTACARKQGSEITVATINDYRMTVDDYNYESKEILRTGRLLGDVPVTKEDILDALIAKEVLLQEAQKEDLDKDRDFMKTIELYWEQTLLRNLLTKKSRDIEKKITLYEKDIIDYYDKMKNRIKAKVLVLTDEKSARRLLGYEGDAAEYVKTEANKFPLAYTIPSKWYTLGEDNSSLENSIFAIDGSRDKEIVKINDRWALVIIEERAPNERGDLPAVRDEIVKRIKMKKERKLMDEWIEGLRSKARIKIDKRVLNELP